MFSQQRFMIIDFCNSEADIIGIVCAPVGLIKNPNFGEDHQHYCTVVAKMQ